MGTKNRFYLIILTFFFLISIISTAYAESSISIQHGDGQLTLIETQITSIESDQITPAIYGDRIVWQDNRSGNWDIYMYNLSTSTEISITANESNQTEPAIYGDMIIWQDDRNGNWDIYMYDFSTQKETQITDELTDQVSPDIHKNRIVWQDKRIGNWDIYMYDLSTQKETQITANNLSQMKPGIYGDRIVWMDERNGKELYLYELSTPRMLFNMLWNHKNLDLLSTLSGSNQSKTQKIIKYLTSREISITTCESNEYKPASIYGNKIVWADRRSADSGNPYTNNPGIYIYDVSTSTETKLTSGFVTDEPCLLPFIFEKRIVWQDGRNGNSDIYTYDLSTSIENQITTNESKQEMPSTYMNRIVWQDERNGNWDIYMCTLAPVDVKPISPISNVYNSGLSLINEWLR